MEPVAKHAHTPDVGFDGGEMDCGNGLLILIRRHIDPLMEGQLLEIRSRESSVETDLPAWCRLTGNELVSWTRDGEQRSYLVSKGAFRPDRAAVPAGASSGVATPDLAAARVEISIPDRLPEPAPAPALRPLSVMSTGSWPRPRWMVQALHDHLEGRLDDAGFQETAHDAVQLAVTAQVRAGVDVVSDGEQRRDSYASFVGLRLDNTQLIPLADLAAMVDEPEKFEAELRALDVPAKEVRHPVVFGPLGRSRPIAGHELAHLKGVSTLPTKVALPGPYLLARTMWLECLEEMPYDSREHLARDVVRVLREEVAYLLADGAAVVQFDEPVLTEVVFSGRTAGRCFMCGALSERKDPGPELDFAVSLINEVTDGFPRDRLAVHVCRGNWTKDEGALLQGDYTALAPYLQRAEVGTLFLELSTPRAGEIDALAALDLPHRIGVGVVNPRRDEVETADEIEARAARAIEHFGAERVLLNSDCGFATFADNPVASARIAEAKLAAMAEAARRLRERHGV